MSESLEAAARVVAVAGPSGVGKSTVVATALREAPQIWLSISYTTRQPRPGEINGQHYVFVSREEFLAIADQGGFVESAEFAGNMYGTPMAPIVTKLASGVSVLLEIDVQGVRQLKARMPEVVTAFIAPPDRDELAARLLGRGTEDAAALEQRLAAADAELAAASEFDVVIVNSDVDAAASQLLALFR